MTEYDYSPQAWERYIATQQRIAQWVDGTARERPCDAFSPATPHLQALKKLEDEKRHKRRDERKPRRDANSDISDDEYDPRYARSSHTRHRKTQSTKETSSYRSPRKERSRERDRERERERERDRERRSTRDRPRDHDRSSTKTPKSERAPKSEKTSRTPKYKDEELEYVWVDSSASSPAPSPRRRSESQSVSSKARPPPSHRSHTAPPPKLDLPPFPQDTYHQYYYHNRHSGHSSRSSATTPNSGSTTHGMFPPGQVPHSAPPITGQAPVLGGTPPKPLRSQTMPHTHPGYQQVTDKNGYPVNRAIGPQPVVLPIRPTMTGSKSYTPVQYAPDPSRVQQYPYAAYPSPGKSQSLLKRMFGFKAKNSSESSHAQQAPSPQYYVPPQEPPMFLGGGGGKRMARQRSMSF